MAGGKIRICVEKNPQNHELMSEEEETALLTTVIRNSRAHMVVASRISMKNGSIMINNFNEIRAHCYNSMK